MAQTAVHAVQAAATLDGGVIGEGTLLGGERCLRIATLAAGAAGLPADRGTLIVTVCNVGRKSLSGMLLLKSLGYARVKNLMGGLAAWTAEGH